MSDKRKTLWSLTKEGEKVVKEFVKQKERKEVDGIG